MSTILTFTAIATLVTETEAEFSKEMDKKQAVIDELHAQLRDASGELGEQRRRVEVMQAEANERDTRKLRQNNLRRAYADECNRLEALKSQLGRTNGDNDLHLGDADNGLAIAEPTVTLLSRINCNPAQPLAIDLEERHTLAASLPPAHVLRARLNAYKSNNQVLEDDVRGLQSKSSEISAKYRKVISLCTSVDENRVDNHLESLLRAIESEPNDVELTRVREFLHRVENV